MPTRAATAAQTIIYTKVLESFLKKINTKISGLLVFHNQDDVMYRLTQASIIVGKMKMCGR